MPCERPIAWPPLHRQKLGNLFRREDLDHGVEMGKILEDRVQLATLGVDQPGEFGAFGGQGGDDMGLGH
jgi:hypothetical protein